MGNGAFLLGDDVVFTGSRLNGSLGQVAEGGIPVPPGQSLPAGLFPTIFRDVITRLGLPQIGLYTPWATRDGTRWTEIQQPPDTNIAAFSMSDALMQAAMVATFNQPLPFVAFLGDSEIVPTLIDQALKSTPYAFYETQAVYDQGDTAPVPRIRFLHWAQRRQPGDPDDGTGSLDQVAGAIGAPLVYAMQIAYQQSARRDVPAISFALALQQQAGGVVQPPAVTPPPSLPTTTAPPGSAGKSYVMPAFVGAGVAAVTFFVVRQYRRK